MTSPLIYEFRLDPAETVRATRDLQRRRRFAWIDWAIWPVLVGLAALYLAFGTNWRDLWLLGLVALFFLALRWLVPRMQRWQLRRVYGETPNLRGLQVYQFSDGGLTITGGAAIITLGWDTFVEVAETDEFFLFFYSKRSAYYLPKRVTGAERDRGLLRTLLRTKLGARARGLRPEDLRAAPA